MEFFVSHLLPVQADMLSACLEYEDMLSDKLRGAHPDPFPSKARLPVAFPKGRGPCSFVLLSHVFLSFCLKKSFCLILKNIKISLLVFSVTLRSITFATDKEHQLRLKK